MASAPSSSSANPDHGTSWSLSASLAFYGFMLYLTWHACKYLVERLFPPNLRGRCVVCIGSTTGFGHEFVLRCARQGMTVFAGCNSPHVSGLNN